MNKPFFFFLSLLLITSCSSAKKNVQELKKDLVHGEEKFNYSDKNGQYLVRMSSGFNKKENSFFLKRQMEIAGSDGSKILEQSVVMSELGSIKKKLPILRPKISQYHVWFEGKKYSSELKMNSAKKAIDVKMVSPESQWNGTKQIKLPSTKALYCFFSQIVECANTSGFLTKAISKEAGVMNLFVIWEGYPYLNETFSEFPSELISRAQFEYDGKTKNEEVRFNLRVAGQSIFYILNNEHQLKKMFWVSQGISMVSKTAKKGDSSDSPENGESSFE